MRAKLLIALFVAALCVAGGWLGGSRTQKPREHTEVPQPTQQPPSVPVMPAPHAPDFTQLTLPAKQSVKIPLDKVYSTSRQKGLKAIPEPPDKSWEEAWKPLFRMLDNTWLSNTFLVVSPDIYGAINETRSRYETLHRVDPLDPDDPRTRDPSVGPTLVWLFVFLGSGADDEMWLLQEIEITHSIITFRVRWDDEIDFTKPGVRSERGWGQAWWVPIPRPEPGSETLIVIEDKPTAPPVFTRRVTVK